MLPLLRKQQESSVNQVDDVKHRKPDEEPEFEMLDAIVEDMLEAISRKDKSLLKAALASLVDHIQHEDQIQDEQEF